jgi:hypothetical protein
MFASRHIKLLVVPAALVTANAIKLDRVALRGEVEPSAQHLTANIGSSVRTLFGPITVTGHANIRYECDGSFTGSVHYGRTIRALASLKNIRLVTSVSGTRDSLSAAGCAAPHDSIFGEFTVRDTLISGTVRYDGRSAAIHGTVRNESGTYHVAVFKGDSGGTRFIMR